MAGYALCFQWIAIESITLTFHVPCMFSSLRFSSKDILHVQNPGETRPYFARAKYPSKEQIKNREGRFAQ